MAFAPGEDPDHRRADEAVALDIPAGALEDCVAGRGETCDVGHLTAGHERVRRLSRKAEELLEPFARDLFRDGRCRPAYDQAGVLIPGTGQPVSGKSCRKRAADDETEVAAARHRDHAAIGSGRQLFDHHERVHPLSRQRTAERPAQLFNRRRRPDRPLVERLEKVARELGGAPKELPFAHRVESMTPGAA